jgi:putative sulfotransferase
MLSNLLREHPKILSISEFFGLVADQSPMVIKRFSSKDPSGQEFWERLSEVHPAFRLAISHNLDVAELIYAIDAPTTRFTRETGIPAILNSTLPHITDAPDVLFDLLRDEVSTWPQASVAEHYARLFGWLMDHFEREIWIERTGGSIDMAPKMMAMFPDARFVHLVRDGRDAALSMREHLTFRIVYAMLFLKQILGVNPYLSDDRSRMDLVPSDLRAFLPECYDAEAIRSYRMPSAFFGDLWVQQTTRGVNFLSSLPADRVLHLRYEDILTAPKGQLDALAAFLGERFIDEKWSARCSEIVRRPRSSWRDLPEEEARALTEACRPGLERLREARVSYDF